MEYFINEGNKIGYLPTEFGESGNSIVEKKIVAAVDIKKGQLVAITGDLEVSVASSASTTVIGVAMIDAKAGEPISVECEGLFKLVASAPITAGAKLSPANLGKVVTATTGQVVGFALNTAGTDGAVYVKFSL